MVLHELDDPFSFFDCKMSSTTTIVGPSRQESQVKLRGAFAVGRALDASLVIRTIDKDCDLLNEEGFGKENTALKVYGLVCGDRDE